MNGTRPILDRVHRGRLVAAAQSNVLVALDYDGTLAPIVDHPDHAAMRPSTARLLGEVALLYPTIVISGRALADIEQRLAGISVWLIYGNHGLEPQHQTPAAAGELDGWRPLLEPLAAEGVRIEDKGYSLTLHYRGAPDRRRVLTAIDAVIATLPGVNVIHGKEAINLLPRGRGNKGDALSEARRAFACDGAIYVGDEDTDEAAFESGGDRTLAIRVEPSAWSSAAYHLGSQQGIDPFLEILIEARRPRRGTSS